MLCHVRMLHDIVFLSVRYVFFCVILGRPPISTRTDTPFPYTTRFRSKRPADRPGGIAQRAANRSAEPAPKPAAAAQQLRRSGGRKCHGRRRECESRRKNTMCHHSSPSSAARRGGPEGRKMARSNFFRKICRAGQRPPPSPQIRDRKSGVEGKDV